MPQEIRQEVVKLATELPDELLAEALVFLQTLTQRGQKTESDNSVTSEASDFDKAMAAYQVISEKYKNALRELARGNEPIWMSEEIARAIHRKVFLRNLTARLVHT